MTNLLPAVTWKMENVSNELLDLPKELSRQNVESNSWIFLIVYGTARKWWTKKNLSLPKNIEGIEEGQMYGLQNKRVSHL